GGVPGRPWLAVVLSGLGRLHDGSGGPGRRPAAAPRRCGLPTEELTHSDAVRRGEGPLSAPPGGGPRINLLLLFALLAVGVDDEPPLPAAEVDARACPRLSGVFPAGSMRRTM